MKEKPGMNPKTLVIGCLLGLVFDAVLVAAFWTIVYILYQLFS